MPPKIVESWRSLTPQEAAVLDRLLRADFPGRNELATQARSAQVRRIDPEGSLSFLVACPHAEVLKRVPVEGYYHDGNAEPGPWSPAVHLLLHVIEGRLHELEVYKDDPSDIIIGPFEAPLEQIEVWTY